METTNNSKNSNNSMVERTKLTSLESRVLYWTKDWYLHDPTGTSTSNSGNGNSINTNTMMLHTEKDIAMTSMQNRNGNGNPSPWCDNTSEDSDGDMVGVRDNARDAVETGSGSVETAGTVTNTNPLQCKNRKK